MSINGSYHAPSLSNNNPNDTFCENDGSSRRCCRS
jgi:hypothetical protein